jgi:hypothetical protein
MKKFVMMIMLMVVTSSMSHADEGTLPIPPCYLCLANGVSCLDPHFVGFDGKKFDIYNTGDFLLLKESDGSEISFTVTNRWGAAASPWITEIRCRVPGGPWMKATAATATPNPPKATVVVDGVGMINNGESYTDPTTSFKVKKDEDGSYIEFVAPRWTLSVRHQVAHVKKDGWHYFNMGVSITSLLKTPVTGVLGVTYNPETYARILGDDLGSNAASSALADHSTSSRSLLMTHGKMIFSAADMNPTSTLRPLMMRRMLGPMVAPEDRCCGTVAYKNTSGLSCCGGVLGATPC